jgi:hypothetical protein
MQIGGGQRGIYKILHNLRFLGINPCPNPSCHGISPMHNCGDSIRTGTHARNAGSPRPGAKWGGTHVGCIAHLRPRTHLRRDRAARVSTPLRNGSSAGESWAQPRVGARGDAHGHTDAA